MQANNEIRNAVEHALLNDEISIETYESIVAALAKEAGGFVVIHMESEKAFVVLP